MFLSLENVINGKTPLKMSIKHPIRGGVSILFMTFFNGIDIKELWSKCQGYLRAKKKFKSKVRLACKI